MHTPLVYNKTSHTTQRRVAFTMVMYSSTTCFQCPNHKSIQFFFVVSLFVRYFTSFLAQYFFLQCKFTFRNEWLKMHKRATIYTDWYYNPMNTLLLRSMIRRNKKKISSQNGLFYEDANLLNYFDPSKNSFDRNDMREQKLTLDVVQHQFARRAQRFLVYFMSGCVAWIVSMPHRMPYTVLKAIWCDGRYKDILRKGHAEISVVFIVLQ